MSNILFGPQYVNTRVVLIDDNISEGPLSDLIYTVKKCLERFIIHSVKPRGYLNVRALPIIRRLYLYRDNRSFEKMYL